MIDATGRPNGWLEWREADGVTEFEVFLVGTSLRWNLGDFVRFFESN